MISVMNNKDYYELDTKSNQIEDNEAKSSRVLNDIAVNGEENFVNSGVSNEARVSPMELDAVAAQSMREAGDFRNERSDDAHGVRDCTDSDDMDVDSRVFEVNSDSASDDRLESKNGKFEPKGDRIVSEVDSDVDLLSEFDDYVANEKHGAMLGTSRALSFGFEVGDMVWGKVKSHPWWPGHIFNEAFATSSVRRTRREGYVLVAFFGDSSYGWFDPAELIPFDRYFTEKSQQTTSRTFVKAVEEAMDEASRRRSLGLACKCRNPYNFRPTNIEGYFAVDVPDYEPNGVYSADQIKKARDRFKPGETLSFVKQLAVAPQGSEQKSFEFMENKATVFTFRKAAFEEYDETYAQAFAVQTARPAQDPVRQKEQPVKAPTRAPLSGPLVIAEALGGGKVAKKPMKVKDYSKKDKYLFKRRDEPSEINQGQPSSLAPSEYMEGSTAAEAGEYVLQKRALALHIPVKSEQPGFVTGDVAGPSVNVSCNLAFQGAAADTKLSLDMLETKERTGSDIPGVVDSTSISLQQEDNDMIDIKHEGGRGLDRVQDGHSVGHPKLVGLKRSIGMTAEGGVKKVKVLKRPSGDLSSESSNMVEKKKKRKKKRALFGNKLR